MTRNILWSGIEYDSMEKCNITSGKDGHEIQSLIVGHYEAKIYQVSYRILTDTRWSTRKLDVNGTVNELEFHLIFERRKTGQWLCNGTEDPSFAQCDDVDIPLTPFTNTLPIRRLNLQEKQTHEINVIYVDVLSGNVRPVKQLYTQLDKNSYHYENVPNDFEADITVDNDGFVVTYPQLFNRVARIDNE